MITLLKATKSLETSLRVALRYVENSQTLGAGPPIPDEELIELEVAIEVYRKAVDRPREEIHQNIIFWADHLLGCFDELGENTPSAPLVEEAMSHLDEALEELKRTEDNQFKRGN